MPSADLFYDWESGEVDPSTRSSLSLITKYAPVDVTLSSAQTAQDLYNVDTSIPTLNLATNPSMETGTPPTGYTAVSATLTRDTGTVTAKNGTYVLKVAPTNAQVGEGFYWATPSLNGYDLIGGNGNVYLNASIYVQDNAGSGNSVQITVADSAGAVVATGSSAALSASWQRISVSYMVPSGTARTYRVYVTGVTQFATNWYADSFQVEAGKSSNITAYCDGSLGVGYQWTGTANASTSFRRKGLVVIRGWDLWTDKDTYFGLDYTATSTAGIRVPKAATMSTGEVWSVRGVNFKRISILNVVNGETPHVFGTIWGVHNGQLS